MCCTIEGKLLANINKLDEKDLCNRIQNLNCSNPKTVTDNVDFNLPDKTLNLITKFSNEIYCKNCKAQIQNKDVTQCPEGHLY